MNLETAIQKALEGVRYPGYSRSILAFGVLQSCRIQGSHAQVSLKVRSQDPQLAAQIEAQSRQALEAVEGLEHFDLIVEHQIPEPSKPSSSAPPLAGVRYALAIASGKGGVGKSTFAVNLACALAQALEQQPGRAGVGIMDCDIYGPSVPRMMGLAGYPELEGEKIVPLHNYGVKVMSMGLLIDEGTPVIWRGPMVTKAIQQFTQSVKWGDLEVLVVDLPPGTGDAQLSLAQNLSLSGVIVVTTPQTTAVEVAIRGAGLFEKLNIPIWGVAENMSYWDPQNTGERRYVFGQGGGQKAAQQLKTPLLGQIPLEESLRAGGDYGIPIVVDQPQNPAAEAFRKIAQQLLQERLLPAVLAAP